MNEIDRIGIINELNKGKETLLLANNTLKYFNIINGKIEFTNTDLDELINYFEKNEYYEICYKLFMLKYNQLI